jgi:hypothetical protein
VAETTTPRRPLLALALASVTVLGISGCVNIADHSDLDLGSTVTVDPALTSAADDTRVEVTVTDIAQARPDDVASWDEFDAAGGDVWLATVDLAVTEGSFPAAGDPGFGSQYWGLMVDDELVHGSRLSGGLAFDDDFVADCPLHGRSVAPELSQGSATTCVVLTAPAGAEPRLVVFDNFSTSGRYSRSQGEASWVVDAS